MTDFHATAMGRRYYESTVPGLVRQLERIADALERLDLLTPKPDKGDDHDDDRDQDPEEEARPPDARADHR
jgi:hypothetical protein